MPATKLDDFQLLSPIGVGTVGTIYAARDRRPDRAESPPLAIKVLHEHCAQNPLIRARFKREIELLRRMRHPNIIASFGGGESDGTLFCVMERVDGGSVGDLLRHRGVLPPLAVASVLGQTASALQCAHNHGVVHRDLKPNNLFLTLDGQVKLGDFGIARDLRSADLSAAGMTVGTHAYMAPEQITGDRSLSGKADLYSLGCCGFEMLTGRPPFSGDSAVEVFEQHLHAAPPGLLQAVPSCPPPLAETISQLLAKHPDQRPFNARAVQGAMLQVLRPAESSDPAIGPNPDPAIAGRLSADDPGRVQLTQCIDDRRGATTRREVSWKVLAAIVLIMVIGLAAVALWTR